MKKVNKLLLLNYLLLFITLILILFNNFIEVYYYKYFYLLVNIVCFVSIIKLKDIKLNFLFGLFIISFNVFLNSRFFMDILGISKMGKIELYYSELKNFNESIIKVMLTCLIISVIFLNFGHLLGIYVFSQKRKPNIAIYNNDTTIINNPILIKLFYILLIIAIFGNILISKQVMIYGYSSLVNGVIGRNIIFTKIGNLSTYLFILLHMYKPPIKELKKIYYAYMIYSATYLFIGQRGYFFVNFLLIIFLWNMYIEEINIKRYLKYILIFPILAQFFSFYRSYFGKISFSYFFKNILDSYMSFFYEQGISVLVIGYAAYYKDELKLNIAKQYFYPFLVSLPFSPYKYQSYSILNNPLSFQQQLSILSKSDQYKNIYNGLGANFIAENYIFGGLILIAIICFAIGYFCIYLEKVKDEKYGIFFQVICVPYILYLPRGETLQMFSGLVNATIKFIIILVLYKIIIKRDQNIQPC
jgi:hypothetical protein